MIAVVSQIIGVRNVVKHSLYHYQWVSMSTYCIPSGFRKDTRSVRIGAVSDIRGDLQSEYVFAMQWRKRYPETGAIVDFMTWFLEINENTVTGGAIADLYQEIDFKNREGCGDRI